MNILCQEIREQPQRIGDCISQPTNRLEAYVKDFKSRNIQHVTIVARGTSRNAALYGMYLLGSQNLLPVQVMQLGLASFLNVIPICANDSVLGISQSGSSQDLCQVMEKFQKAGCLTLGVTNAATGRMNLFTDHMLEIHAGPEIATAATKSFVNQMVTLALLSNALLGNEQAGGPMISLPSVAQAILDKEQEIEKLGRELGSRNDLLVVGRGFNHVLAAETALKMQEICYVRALPFTTADFLHGPIALLDEQGILLCIDAGKQYNGHFEAINRQAKESGCQVFVITNCPERWPDATRVLSLPKTNGLPDYLWPIPAMVACQLLVMYMGLTKGLNVSHPRHLIKETSTV